MKFVLAVCGTRGDVEPCAAVGLDLLRRGHEVRMAVAPNFVDFVESAGIAAVAFGPDSEEQLDGEFMRNLWKMQNPIRLVREAKEFFTRDWAEMSRTLTSLADGADLALTGGMYTAHVVTANVAEYYDIPLAVLDYYPIRANGQVILGAHVPILPPRLVRSATSTIWWLGWRISKEAEDAQRRELGLPTAAAPLPRRMVERGSLELQAYDDFCFPGLAAEWGGRRPFVGALTMQLTTDADDEVMAWIGAGTPPIYFGFGSMPVRSPRDTVTMIGEACAQLGERALICAGASDFRNIPHVDHVKVVGAVNHAGVFPACRAVVHHGGAGTTAASMRAGVPTLILWTTIDQPIWAAHLKRLKVGSGRRLSATTRESLVADLCSILAPQYVTRAREIATRITKPAESVTAAADLVEATACAGRFG
jgi:UDP:flavonoid glycosyltransferase YjiC (YdhE family)